MKVIIEIDVTGCSDCLFKAHNTGHGENFDYCKHPNAPKGYESIIQCGTGMYPFWCPIFKKEEA